MVSFATEDVTERLNTQSKRHIKKDTIIAFWYTLSATEPLMLNHSSLTHGATKLKGVL